MVDDAVGTPPAGEPQLDDSVFDSFRGPVRAGSRRLETSFIAAGPPARYLSAHFFAVAGEYWNRSAARRNGHPSSTTDRARANLPRGDR